MYPSFRAQQYEEVCYVLFGYLFCNEECRLSRASRHEPRQLHATTEHPLHEFRWYSHVVARVQLLQSVDV
jgi:hypothetical protein